MDGGTLSLTAVPGQTHGKQYVSGMISSYGKFSFTYGYAQIVAELPRGRGLWPAFWTLPEAGGWPPEIDIMENWAQTDTIDLFVHYGRTGLETASASVPTASGAFHTYGVDWEPGSISWYIDGTVRARFAVSITSPEYLLASLAVAGDPAPDASTRFPQSLKIRSIDVWQHLPTAATGAGLLRHAPAREPGIGAGPTQDFPYRMNLLGPTLLRWRSPERARPTVTREAHRKPTGRLRRAGTGGWLPPPPWL